MLRRPYDILTRSWRAVPPHICTGLGLSALPLCTCPSPRRHAKRVSPSVSRGRCSGEFRRSNDVPHTEDLAECGGTRKRRRTTSLFPTGEPNGRQVLEVRRDNRRRREPRNASSSAIGTVIRSRAPRRAARKPRDRPGSPPGSSGGRGRARPWQGPFQPHPDREDRRPMPTPERVRKGGGARPLGRERISIAKLSQSRASRIQDHGRAS